MSIYVVGFTNNKGKGIIQIYSNKSERDKEYDFLLRAFKKGALIKGKPLKWERKIKLIITKSDFN